ncbi:MAG: precorrin-4 C(11)-methyltransferase, partial [Gammaproteobacteria bacterium]|nr:precorrin-4 C(11)-methyltransferase [Gammaproteobacteria bacterium]
MTVYFIGAGPGDPELMTIKGQRLLDAAPVVLFAGSLIPEENMATAASRGALVVDTASLALEAIIEYMVAAHDKGQDVARLHSGDPMLYGAIGEQIRRLDELGIDYQ